MDLSVIIVSYNTRELLVQTIESLSKSLDAATGISSEVIVVDNGSTDDSIQYITAIAKSRKNVSLVKAGKNLGFSKANNVGVRHARGEFILFLNSDTVAAELRPEELITYFKTHEGVGALTVRVVLPDGSLDPACHRGFPTVWRSFAYLSGLERISTPLPLLNRLFGGYHLTHLPRTTVHDVDAISGAFFLMRKSDFEKIGGFDESFFMYGEDIDLAYRLRAQGLRIVYYPRQTITHIKGQSGMRADVETTKKQTSAHFYDAMKIFYHKHYERRYPSLITRIIMKVIDSRAASAARRH